MKRFIILISLLLASTLYSNTKIKFRGYVESSGLCNINLNMEDPNNIKREVNQGFSLLSNQYIKIVPEKGMSIVASISQSYLSGIENVESADDSYKLNLEIERLFCSYRVDGIKTSFGVQRLSRGFNFAFTPFDFINENDLTASNSPKGKLSFVSDIETSAFSNISLYYIAPKDPLETEIWSSITGLLFKHYGGFVDFQVQYNLLFPEVYNEDYNHLLGIAFKGDFIVGYTSEVVYRLNADDIVFDQDYLDLSIGIDYTFDLEKELAVRFEYFFNGSGLNSVNDWYVFSTEMYPFKHNFYGSLKQTINDDVSIELSGIVSPVTTSGIGMLDLDYRVSDSSYLSLSANVPMDKTNWEINNLDIDMIGEYGPVRVGNELSVKLSYKIKF